MEQAANNRYDRLMGWALPAIAALTPLVVVYMLVRPNVGQAYFFEGATLLALAGLGLAWALGWRALPGRPRFVGWAFLLNALAALLSLTASQSWGFSLKQALLPGCGLVFFGLLVTQPERGRLLERLRLILTFEAGLLALYGILQWRGIEFLNYGPQVEKNRVIATIGHPNFLASAVGPLLFAALGLAFSRQGLAWKIVSAAVSGLILMCVALAQARGAWLGVALGLAAAMTVGARYCRRRGLPLRWLANLALVGVLLTVGLGAVTFKARPNRGAQSVSAQNEVKSRMFYWRAAVDMAMQKRLFGQGYAMFDPKFWDYTLELQRSPQGAYYQDVLPAVVGVTPEHVHNEYLEVLAEEGFFGFGALAALLGFFLFFGYWAIMRLEETGRALQGAMIYGALVMIMVDAMFGFPWRLPASLIVFMAVLAWLYDLIYPERPAAEPAPAQ